MPEHSATEPTDEQVMDFCKFGPGYMQRRTEEAGECQMMLETKAILRRIDGGRELTEMELLAAMQNIATEVIAIPPLTPEPPEEVQP